MSGREAADSITICRQLQEKDWAKKKVFYFVFVNFEKAFGQIPRDVVWWALRKREVEEWLVRIVQPIFGNERSPVKVNGS